MYTNNNLFFWAFAFFGMFITLLSLQSLHLVRSERSLILCSISSAVGAVICLLTTAYSILALVSA